MDITDRGRNDSQESEERFRSLFENATLGIYRTTPSGRILAANPTLIRMLGYRDFESLATRNLEEEGFEPSYQRKTFSDRMEQDNKVIGLESAWTRQDGTAIFVRESAQAIRGPDGNILYYDGIIEDITQRKREEVALRESEARFDQLAERSLTITWEVDPQGLFTFVSHVSEIVWGYTPDEVVGRMHFYDLHPEEGREAFKVGLSAVTGQREPFNNVVHPVKTKDGRIVWGSANGVPMLNDDGTFRGYRGSCSDITERKHAEDALRHSEERFRNIFRNAGVGMVIVSPEGRYLAANRSFCECLGYTEEELLTKTVESITLPDDWPDFSEKLVDTLSSGDGFKWAQKRCLHKSGRIVYTESSTSLIRNCDGSPQYFVADVLDITSRKQAEEELSKMTRKLIEAQENERARIGRELHDDVCQRLVILSMEAAQLARNPSEIDVRAREIQTHLIDLSNDVNALAHDLHTSKLEYLGAIGGMESWGKEFARRLGLEVNFTSDVRSALPHEIGISLFRVLQEAFQNVVKHSHGKRIDVELREDSESVHLIVRDSGKGFDVDSAAQGKGLGLTSMRERVRLVNGTITIDSNPNSGTAIRVLVPIGVSRAS